MTADLHHALPAVHAVITALAGLSGLLGDTGTFLTHLVYSLGIFGVFVVSIVDSSFVPLPVPGMTDIMLVLYAAQRASPLLLIIISTAGSALGGWLSYEVGQSGGLAFIEKRTPARIFKRVTTWMEHHAILAVALPALLPPPMPLSPFVLAAGALKMRRRTFILTFTVSRLLRHALAVWLGLRYGKHFLVLWNRFSEKWGTSILLVIWVAIAISVGYAFWQLWKTSKSVGVRKVRVEKTVTNRATI